MPAQAAAPAPGGIDPNSIPSIASAGGPDANSFPSVSAAVTPEREFLPLPTSNKMDMIRSRVVEHATREPETVARLVRMWLNDGDE